MTAVETFDFEEAFRARIVDVTEACVSCGKCFEACPITSDAGIDDQPPTAITDGILDILKTGTGSDAAEKWARSCILSGECIKVCEYGVNPRLMLSMARMSLAEHLFDDHARRGAGVNAFRELGKGVKVLSKMQLSEEDLTRLGQGPDRYEAKDSEPPDYVFYTGCNVLKTPHIALLCLDIMDRLGVSYRVLGGPSHCCGVIHYRDGDLVDANRMSSATIEKFM